MITDKVRQFLNLVAGLTQPVVAILANTGITGPEIGTISNQYPTYVVPAGYAFSIWSVIFSLSLGYAVYQALPSQRTNSLFRKIGFLTASAMTATSVWMLVFQRSLFLLSLVVMLWLLISLISVITLMYTELEKQLLYFSRAEYILVYMTFSIFVAWITVATVANIAQVLTVYNWNGSGLQLETWGVIAIILVGVLTSVLTKALWGNLPFAITIIWALVGVAVNQYTKAVPTNSFWVGSVAMIASMLVGITALISRKRRVLHKRI
jgi:hypothetical protein